jgi:hypothetical protein
MRSMIFMAGILGTETLLAHPGHGMPGWVHPHVADYALVLLGIFFLAGIVYGMKKLFSRK